MPVEAPLVQTFNIAAIGWQFVDQRRLSDADLFDMHQKRNRHLRKFWEGSDVLADMCDADERVQAEITRRWLAASERWPGITYEQFRENGGEVVHSGCADPRKYQLNFGIRTQADGWIGGMHLGNWEIERDENNQIKATALFWLGAPPAEGFTIAQTWGGVMRWLIRNDITLANGKVVDIVGFDFLGPPMYYWRKSRLAKLSEMIGALTVDANEENDPADSDVLLKLRRKGA